MLNLAKIKEGNEKYTSLNCPVLSCGDCMLSPNQKDLKCESNKCVDVRIKNQKTAFVPSTVVYSTDPITGKTIPTNCNYDKNRNKVAIIIKERGYYDNSDTIGIFSQYFAAVKNHLGIENIGIKKFNGSTIEEFDAFIESLIKNHSVGYALIIGQDLPVVTKQDAVWLTNPKTGKSQITQFAQWILDLDNENNIYSYVNRDANGCKDIALSFVFEPVFYNDLQKKEFVKNTFSNFINYHTNYNSTINSFTQKILYVMWDDNLPGGETKLGLNKESILNTYPNYKFFYPAEVLYNSEVTRINVKLKEKPLLWMFFTHGAPKALGLGFKEPIATTSINLSEIYQHIFTTNEDILSYSKNGPPSLFIIPDSACSQDVIYDGQERFCCWSQTWLKAGVWALMDVGGYFEKSLNESKIVGDALKKTYHNQGMIYGDILAKLP